VEAFVVRKSVEEPVFAKKVVEVALTAVRFVVEAVVRYAFVAVMPVVEALVRTEVEAKIFWEKRLRKRSVDDPRE
jgi:hypothetical protein